jgi:hypothetical protein
MLPSLVLAAIGAAPCWNIFDAALRHSATAQHPPYVSYDERIHVTQDDQRLVQSIAFVDYRDDGVARVRDERFDFAPILTRHQEPGPPELGPYGSQRSLWLPQLQFLPTIADVRSQGDMTCTNLGIESYKGHDTYHLQFTQLRSDRPALKDLWIDARSNDIWKLIVSGYVNFEDDTGAPPGLADFQVELGYVGRYLVVNHVVWQYSRREFSQTSEYFAEYTLSGYRFPDSLPPSYFGTI